MRYAHVTHKEWVHSTRWEVTAVSAGAIHCQHRVTRRSSGSPEEDDDSSCACC